MLSRWPLLVLAFGLIVVLVSCAGRGGVSISVSPGEVTLAPGESVEFSAVVMGGAGTGVVWSSSGGLLVPSGLSAVFTAPAEVGEYTVTARSVRDEGRWASAVVAVLAEHDGGGLNPPPYTGEEPVFGETDDEGAVVVVSETLGVQIEVVVEAEGGVRQPGVVVSYEEFDRTILLMALDPVSGAGSLMLFDIDDLFGGVVDPSSGSVGTAVTLTLAAVSGGIAGGTFSWRLSRAHQAGRVVEASISSIPAAAVADGVVEICASPYEFVEAVQALALQQKWLDEAYRGAAESFVLSFVLAAVPPVGGVIGPVTQQTFEWGATAAEVSAIAIEVAHLLNEDPVPLARQIHYATMSAYPELGPLAFEETLQITLLDYRVDAQSMGAGGVSWSAAIVSGVGCDRATFGTPIGSASIVTPIGDLSRQSDADITVAVEPPQAGLRVFLSETVQFEDAIDTITLHRRFSALTNFSGLATITLSPPTSTRDIPSLRTSQLTISVPDRYVLLSESATWSGALGTVAPDAYNLGLDGREAALGQPTELRFFTTRSNRAATCEVDWDDGRGWSAFDCPRARGVFPSAPTGGRVQHTYNAPGVYLVRVRVTSSEGQASSDLSLVSVTDPRNAPAQIVRTSVNVKPADLGNSLTASTTWLVRDVVPGDEVSCTFADGSQVLASSFPCDLEGSSEFTFGAEASELVFIVSDGQNVTSSTIDVSGAMQDVSVSVSPSQATLPPAGTQSFTATVTNADDTSVTWSATCGGIGETGNPVTYTAPATPGSCTVTATSIAEPSKSASASVTVVASPASVGLLVSAGETTSSDRDLYVLDESGQASLLLDTAGRVVQAHWSADRTALVITDVVAADNRDHRIIRFGAGFNVVSDERLLQVIGPACCHGGSTVYGWHPDQESFLYKKAEPSCAGNRVWRRDLDGEEAVFLDPAIVGDGVVYAIDFHPTLDEILWISQVGCWSPTLAIHRAAMVNGAIDTSTIKVLLDDGKHVDPARYSPDGSVIAFVRSDASRGYDGPENLYIMNRDGTSIRALTANTRADQRIAGNVAWSADGKRLAFSHRSTDSGGAYDVYVVDVDGTKTVRLTASERHEFVLAW